MPRAWHSSGMDSLATVRAVCAAHADFLTGAQIQALQEWATEKVTAVSPHHQAETETAVLTILQLVPQLLGPQALPNEEGVIDAPVIRLYKNLAWLAGQPAARSHKPLRLALQAARREGNAEHSFQILLQILHAHG